VSRSLTTTDLWKFVGLIFVFVDHYGLFFDEDQEWWRVIGRLAAPIFFFLIGFARTRTVPWIWLGLGTLLTLLDYLTSDSLAEVRLNILFDFALIRLALPYIENNVAGHLWRVLVLAAVCTATTPLTSLILEYGSDGWLWAVFGLVHRLWLSQKTHTAWVIRNCTAASAATLYAAWEIIDFEFGLWPAVVTVLLVTALTLFLTDFRRTELNWTPPDGVAAGFAFCGQRSLEIYAVSLIVMQLLSFAIESN